MNTIKKVSALTVSFFILVFMLSFTASAAFKPKKPSVFKAISVSADSVELKWKKSSGADSYRVYVKNNGEWKLVKALKQNTYKVKGLNASKTYAFAVKSVNSSGGKKYFCDGYATLTVKTAKLSATKLSASAGVNFVNLKWKKVPGATGYNVYRKVNGEWKYLKKLSASSLSYRVEKLKYNTTYCFAVRALSSSGGKLIRGPYSASVKIKTLKANKVSVKCTASTENSVTLTWTKAWDATGYRIYISENGKWKGIKNVKPREKLTTVIKSLKSDSKYTFCVKAFNDASSEIKWFVPSDSCIATTDPTSSDLNLYRTKNLSKILKGKEFTLSYVTADAEYGKVPVVVSKNGNKYLLCTKVYGVEYILLADGEENYIVFPEKKAYTVMPASLSKTVNVRSAVNGLLPPSNWNWKIYLADFSGKKVVCETYTHPLKTKEIKYYYRAGELVAIEEYGLSGKLVERAYVSSVKAYSTASKFRIPDGYTSVK